MRAFAMTSGAGRRARYTPPGRPCARGLQDLVAWSGREVANRRQLDMLRTSGDADALVYVAGDTSLLSRRVVSIVGTREVSDDGRRRAARLGRELAAAGVVVMSGLARGVDTAALTAAIEAGGAVAAVIGTPLDKAYPAENAALQETIWRDHLLVSPFQEGETVYKSNFPKRNRVMAMLSDATVIVEASDTSGTLHQAAECARLGRWLFIVKSVANDSRLEWPRRFVGQPKVKILESTDDVLEILQ